MARYVDGNTYLWVSCLDEPEPEAEYSSPATGVIITELSRCRNYSWMLQFEFNGFWNPQMEISMKQVVTGLASQCNIYLREDDVSNPGMYGRCEIKHGEYVTWNMADETLREFEYVDNFNLGNQASGEGTDENVIARYMTLTDEGNFYL